MKNDAIKVCFVTTKTARSEKKLSRGRKRSRKK
jgi:hypothetical protein